MRQTLFMIPHELAGMRLFGDGWVLLGWAIFSVLLMIWMVYRHGWNRETMAYVPFLLIAAAVIYFVLPQLEVKLPGAEKPLGLPIRGYGVMLMLGVVSGVGLAAYRARQVGIDPELIYGLAIWMFLLGIGGARLFYVVEFWHTVEQESWQQTVLAIIKFNEGGLVVYGSLIGALIGFGLFSRRHRLPILRLADVIAPSMLIGLAIGRIGCLLNGCCYGGICEDGPVAIRFPKYSSLQERTFSPPYAHQLSMGSLHGIRIGEVDAGGHAIVARVEPRSKAAASGIPLGATIKSINGVPVDSLDQARRVLSASSPHISLETGDDCIYAWSIGELPDQSLRVHPTQLYSATNALLLFAVLWFLFPLRTWDGAAFGVLLTIYPLTRFLLEMIRDDGVARLGTGLKSAQIVSLLTLIMILAYWYCVFRQPRLGREQGSHGTHTSTMNPQLSPPA